MRYFAGRHEGFNGTGVTAQSLLVSAVRMTTQSDSIPMMLEASSRFEWGCAVQVGQSRNIHLRESRLFLVSLG